MATEPRNDSSYKSAAVCMPSKNGCGGVDNDKPSRESGDDLVSPRSVLEGYTTSSDVDAAAMTDGTSCTMGSSSTTSTTTGAVAAYTVPSTPASSQNDGPPAAWKGVMEAWRSRTKRRLSTVIPSTMSSKLRSLSIRSSGKWRWPSAGQVNVEQHDLCALRLSFRTFSLSELRKATRNFSKENVVGRGGHAKVYRGLLPDGQLVAVKKLSATENDRMESFLSELGHAVNVRHPNVARLVGVGLEGGEHLVFPFSRLGCLSRRLHGGAGDGEEGAMPWEARYKVALGAASGLEYLHERCARRIVHRDVKPANILLQDDYEPLICDFGLAKWLPDKLTHYQVTIFEGTFGYVPPEYTTHGIFNEKTDVFAFGVVLLELLTGRRAIDGKNFSLVAWVRSFLSSKDEVLKMVDPALGGRYDEEQLRRVTHAAQLCIHASPSQRPRMSQVARILQGDQKTHHQIMGHERANTTELHEIDDYESPTPRTYLHDITRHKALAFDF
ncbi:receptor-like cytosolic serine/threonine-protein kinase RBK2 [Hordeum vulgare subsp. vulgare]|uniref:receptor-like cytosolic serine/threonine-protein kinase RBK2 n=1 Tax=Hordeum vulgare subsp. vulgare TaxID=112509 RepID=UPI00162B8FCE|nr:receptor-like cytosolic serine/threonine-protein kinase RBK2 [Hordeum vulgare subsp. vulgare]